MSEQDVRLAEIGDEWAALGRSVDPADRGRAEAAVRAAIEAAGVATHSMVFVWVPSPMAGVLVSTYLGFALGDAAKGRMTLSLNDLLTRGGPKAQRLRADVDDAVGRGRTAVHTQVAAELVTRGPAWEQHRREMGNHAWDRVWQTIGDPLYSHGWEQQAQASEGLFEENLTSWADAMMEGQFDAGAMAQLDAMRFLEGVDVTAFDGIRTLAANCSWWWPYEVGAVLCERPVSCELDGEHVTIEYRDGWAVRT